jgi:hypothetical protein
MSGHKETCMSDVTPNRRGLALPTAVFLLVLVGALVAAGLFVGIQDQRAGDNTRRLQQSFGVAELGAAEQVRSWNNAWNTIAVYPTAGSNPAIASTAVGGIGAYQGKVFHLGSKQYLLDITGRDTRSGSGAFPGGGARQRIGLLVRSMPTNQTVNAAYVVGGGLGKFRGGWKVTGNDSTPPGWSGCVDQGDVAGFASSDTSAYKQGGGNLNGVTGAAPDVIQSSAYSSAELDTIGNTGITYSQMAAMATVTVPGGTYTLGPPMPVVAGGVCNTGVTSNWGSPLSPAGACGNYFPIIHVTGNLTVRGVSGTSQGQGILLVDGDVKAFDFTFAGMVVIKGIIDSTHFFKVWGGVQVINANNSAFVSDTWDVTFAFSSCSLAKSLSLAVPQGVSPLRSRSWAELY